MDLLTRIQTLSTQLQSALSGIDLQKIIQQQINNPLSGTNILNQSLSALDTIICELTSVPVHPYDVLLSEYFEDDHKFKTLDDVPDPGQDLPYEECLKFLRTKEEEFNKTTFHNLTCKPEQQLTSVYQAISCDKIICDKEREKNYLEFFEMVRRIPAASITPETCDIITRKIIGEYMRVC